MFAIRSISLKALGLAAAVALTAGPVFAGPPPKGQGSANNPGAGSQAKINLPSGGLKPIGGLGGGSQPSGGQNKPIFDPGKIDPSKGGGIKIDPGMGNGNKPNGPGKPIDPGIGNGKPNGKPWMQPPGQGMQKTVFCKNPCPKDYCFKYGMKCSFGYCYKGYNHSHWYCNRWSDQYGCWFFYDPCCTAWYYWCEPDLCYYPVTYVPYRTFVYVAPTPVVLAKPVIVATAPTYYVAPQPVVTTTTTTIAANANVVAGGPSVGPGPTGDPGMKLPPLPGEQQ